MKAFCPGAKRADKPKVSEHQTTYLNALRTTKNRKLKELWKIARRDETLARLADDCYRSTDDVNPAHLVNLQNGIVDITGDAGVLKPHSPYHFSTMQFNAGWAEELLVEDSRFDTFLREIVVPEDVPRIYEMFGYCMVASAEMHKAFLLVGEGSNGKSTLLMVLTELLRR